MQPMWSLPLVQTATTSIVRRLNSREGSQAAARNECASFSSRLKRLPIVEPRRRQRETFRARGERGAAATHAIGAQVHILIASICNPGSGLTSGNELQCDPPLNIGFGTSRKTNYELGRAEIVFIQLCAFD